MTKTSSILRFAAATIADRISAERRRELVVRADTASATAIERAKKLERTYERFAREELPRRSRSDDGT
jgi:hypothetical protein